MAKTERFELRLTKEEKKAIEVQAAKLGMKVCQFLVWKALHEDNYYKDKFNMA